MDKVRERHREGVSEIEAEREGARLIGEKMTNKRQKEKRIMNFLNTIIIT